MKTKVDARLVAESARFAFRFACDDCAHFEPGRAGDEGRCGHGYPPSPRRDALTLGASCAFCKEFELT